MNAHEELSLAAKAMEVADSGQLWALARVAETIALRDEAETERAMRRLSAQNIIATQARAAFLAALDKARLAYQERDLD